MGVPHISIDLRLRNKCCNRVNNNNVDGSAADHRLADLKRLLPVIRLRNIQIINIHPNVLRIDWIQRMFGINKAGNAAPLLHFRHHMECNCCLSG